MRHDSLIRRAPIAVALAAALMMPAACSGGRGLASPDAATDPADATAGGDGLVACSVTAPTACPTPAPHYPDIAPILEERCVPCHNGADGGPWPLTDYKHAADWFDLIPPVLLDCTMPPPDAGVPITNEERRAILTWLRCGFPP